MSSSQRQLEFSERAHRVIPGGAHTYSRGDDQFPELAPRCFIRGKGARVWDLDNTEFVDWGMGINNVLVGHAEDSIDDAAISAIRHGQSFSRPSLREVDLAERLVALFPGMEMAKFAKNGSDANTAAVRLARAITGRPCVGFDETAPFLAIHDWFIGTTAVSAGVPDAVRDLTRPFRFNDIESVDTLFAAHASSLAAVVLEVCRDVRPTMEFLQRLQDQCSAHGVLMIIDEIVTGFRYDRSGAYSQTPITPDFISVGKALANGYALSALLGKRRHMERGGIRHGDDRVFFMSTTNGPEQSALAAGLATIQFYEEHDVIPQLYRVGQALIDAVNEAARSRGVAAYVSAGGDYACRPILRFLDRGQTASAAYRTLFVQEMARRRVFMPWVCPSFRHGASEINQTREALDSALAIYADALDAGGVERFLTGPAAKPVFRRRN